MQWINLWKLVGHSTLDSHYIWWNFYSCDSQSYLFVESSKKSMIHHLEPELKSRKSRFQQVNSWYLWLLSFRFYFYFRLRGIYLTSNTTHLTYNLKFYKVSIHQVGLLLFCVFSTTNFPEHPFLRQGGPLPPGTEVRTYNSL